jgi:hypothetical protein
LAAQQFTAHEIASHLANDGEAEPVQRVLAGLM